MEFRADINGLRAVAVLAVLCYHFAVPGFGGGFAGVDIFYVISGYLMTSILRGQLLPGRGGILKFYLARCRRILPALLGLCAAVLLLGWFWVAPSHYADLASHAAASVAFVSNILYWREVNYFNPDAEGFWFLHTWSLSVEWQFYLLYPLFLILLGKLSAGAGDARFRLLFMLTLAGSFALAVLAAARAPQAAFYLLPPRAWELMLGGLVCLYESRLGLANGMRRVLAIAGLLLTLGPVFLLDDGSPWATLLVGLPVAGTAMVLLARSANPLLDNGVFQRLGLWSYSIYLWHWPIAVVLRESGLQGPAGIAAGMALSLLCGYASFRLIETPSRKGLAKRPAGGQLLWQLGAAAGIAAFSLAVIHARGFQQRTPVAHAEQYRQMEADRLRWDYPVECSAQRRTGLPPVCTVGNPDAPRRVLVLGDSHAQQWYAWFSQWAQRTGTRVDFATYEGCPAGYETRPGLDCEGFWTAARTLPASLGAQQVLLFSNWQIPGIDEPATDAAAAATQAALHERLAGRMPALLAALRAGGSEVTLIGALPRVGRLLPDDITSRLFRGGNVDPLRSTDCPHFHALARDTNDKLRLLADEGGARFADPLPSFCDGDRMAVISDDNHLLFRDGNHVSSVGALRYGDRVLGRLLD